MKNPLNNKSSSMPVVALLLFLVAMAGAIFYVKPTWDEVTNLDAQMVEKTDERNELNAELVELQKLQQELQESSEVTRQATLSAIPEKLEQDKLLQDLSTVATANDMILNSVNFGIPTAAFEGEVASASINANLTGNQSSLISFLRDIEGNTRKMVVNSVTVQIGETDVGITRVNFNLNMETYFQGQI